MTVFSKLLIPTRGIQGGPEQSLIGRGRQTKIPNFPFHTFPGFHPQHMPVKKVTLASSSVQVSPPNNLKVLEGSKATMSKVEQPSDKVMAGSPVPSSSVITELFIPTSLQRIQDSRSGPLSVFLDAVQRELCKVGKLSNDRLQLLGIRGEYTRVPVNQSGVSVLTKDGRNGSMISQSVHHNELETMTDQHVIVELEILPGSRNEESPAEDVFALWKAQLLHSGSSLLRGPLGTVLSGATMQREAHLGMNSRIVFNNAFKSSAVLHGSLSWTFALFCAFRWKFV